MEATRVPENPSQVRQPLAASDFIRCLFSRMRIIPNFSLDNTRIIGYTSRVMRIEQGQRQLSRQNRRQTFLCLVNRGKCAPIVSAPWE
jgi:hypothetical protein